MKISIMLIRKQIFFFSFFFFLLLFLKFFQVMFVQNIRGSNGKKKERKSIRQRKMSFKGEKIISCINVISFSQSKFVHCLESGKVSPSFCSTSCTSFCESSRFSPNKIFSSAIARAKFSSLSFWGSSIQSNQIKSMHKRNICHRLHLSSNVLHKHSQKRPQIYIYALFQR